jgi:hypothetical protein
MFTVSDRIKRIGAAFALAGASMPLVSVAPPPGDPSLLAAPEYRPDLWNDVSNENLVIFNKRYASLVEKISRRAYEADKEKASYLYGHTAHTNIERAYTAIRTLADQSKQNTPDTAMALAAYYGGPVYEMVSALADARAMYRPKGIQPFNNCLSYSVDDRDVGKEEKDYAATPGHRTLGYAQATKIGFLKPMEYDAFVRQTIRGNESDGMIFTGTKMQSREGYYRVALFTRRAKEGATNMYEGHEYHYMRQNRDGSWSQKFGGLNVVNTDYSGKLLTNPMTAAMGPYNFTGYFLVPKGGLDVGPPEEKATKTGTRPAFDPAQIVVLAPARP